MRVHNTLWFARSARREHDEEWMIERKLFVRDTHMLQLCRALKVVQRYAAFPVEPTVTSFAHLTRFLCSSIPLASAVRQDKE